MRYYNWPRESISAGGTGNLTLTQISGFPRLSDLVPLAEEVAYAIYSDDSKPKEVGLGQLLDANTFVRTTVQETYDGGVFDETTPAPVNVQVGWVLHLPATHQSLDIVYEKNINAAAEKVSIADADKFGLRDSAASNVLKYVQWSTIKSVLQTYFDALYTAWDAVEIAYTGGFLGATDVEGALDELAQEKAGLAEANVFTSTNRTNEVTDNDGSFDLNAAIDFKCTPTAGFALTFTNIPASPGVQKGTILLDNSGGYAITAAATTKVGASLLSTISVAGIYTLGYRSSNGNVYVTSSGAQA